METILYPQAGAKVWPILLPWLEPLCAILQAVVDPGPYYVCRMGGCTQVLDDLQLRLRSASSLHEALA